MYDWDEYTNMKQSYNKKHNITKRKRRLKNIVLLFNGIKQNAIKNNGAKNKRNTHANKSHISIILAMIHT